MDFTTPENNLVVAKTIDLINTLHRIGPLKADAFFHQVKEEFRLLYRDGLLPDDIAEPDDIVCERLLNCFQELCFHNPDDADSEDISLIIEKDGFVTASGIIPVRLSNQERTWLYHALKSPHAKLFLTETIIQKLLNALEGIQLLYSEEDITYSRTAFNRDLPIDLPQPAPKGVTYEHLQAIIHAIKNTYTLKISYLTARSKNISKKGIPYRLEFSVREGGFRLWLFTGQTQGLTKINIGRIVSISKLPEKLPQLYKAYNEFLGSMKAHSNAVPGIFPEIHLLITDRHNTEAIERAGLCLANYPKTAFFKDHTLHMKLYPVYRVQEQQLLETILSFGPNIEILDPPELREKMIQYLTGRLFWQ